MKALLDAIKAALETAGRKVEIMPDERAYPEWLAPPYDVLVDGGIMETLEGLSETTATLTARVICYYPALAKAESIVGGGHRDGIEVYAQGAKTALKGNLLGLEDYEAVRLAAEAPAGLWGDDKGVLIRKVLAYEYTRVDT